MGGGGIAVAFVLVVVLTVLALLLVAAAVLFVVDASIRRHGAVPTPWLRRCATALVMFVVAVPAVTFAYASVIGDPDELQLDLRTPIDEDRLPGNPDPSAGGLFDYDSERIVLRLPDDRQLATAVESTLVGTDDGVVESVAIRTRALPPREAVARVRDWARRLDLETPALDAAAEQSERAWKAQAGIGSVTTQLSLQPVAGGERMIARARFTP